MKLFLVRYERAQNEDQNIGCPARQGITGLIGFFGQQLVTDVGKTVNYRKFGSDAQNGD
jgi:hypothetical protein